ncbi:MAG TPA: GDP-mannose 4,6-dehydratase, partial [Acidobacteriota bacterium]
LFPEQKRGRSPGTGRRGQPLTLIGAGSDLRDYIHVADACAAIMACLDRAPAGEIINVGSGTATTLDVLLALLARLTAREPLIRRRSAAAADTRRLLADIGKAERLLGWKPGTGLEAGLKNFVSWLMSAENQFN